MEEKEQGAKLTLHDISQALAGARDEELNEFAKGFVQIWNGCQAASTWPALSFEKQRETLARYPWLWGVLHSLGKLQFKEREERHKEGKSKAPWWMFWK